MLTDFFFFDLVNAINDVDVGISSLCWIFICYEVCHMFLNDWSCYLNWYNTIVLQWYLKCWFNGANCCLLFTVLHVSYEFSIPLYITILFLIPSIWKRKLLLYIYAENNLCIWESFIIKLWVNLNSAILKCKAVIPRAVIGEPSAVFILAVVGCMGVL